MIMSMDSEFLYSYAEKIKDHFFPDNKKIKLSKKTFTKSVERLDECFTSIKKKYYYEDGKPIFNHLNSDQFCTFLYFLSNQSFIETFENNPSIQSYSAFSESDVLILSNETINPIRLIAYENQNYLIEEKLKKVLIDQENQLFDRSFSIVIGNDLAEL